MEQKLDRIKPERCKVIACATVIEEMLPLMPPRMSYEVLEFGLHADPQKLNNAIQTAIDLSAPSAETILLGYGLCSQAVVGLKSENRTLILPKVDDCIAIFLGSADKYNQQHKKVPGTLYMTKGWIEAGNSPVEGHVDMVKRYGKAKARWLFKQMFRNYTRLVFVDTGNYELDYYRSRSKSVANELNLRYEEIRGSNSIITRILFGPWDNEFVIVPPGKKISFLDFRNS